MLKSQFNLLTAFSEDVVKKLSGEGYSNQVNFIPSDTLFIGNLYPAPIYQKVPTSKSRFAPNAIGLEFKIAKDFSENAELEITSSCSLYYRVMPSFEQQISSVEQGSKAKDVILKPIFNKIYFKPKALTLKVKELVEANKTQNKIPLGISSQLDSLVQRVSGDPNLFSLGRRRMQKIPMDRLADKDSYEKYLSTNFLGKCLPKWNIDMFMTIREEDDYYHFQIIMLNTAKIERDDKGIYEKTLYETLIDVNLKNAQFSKFNLDSLLENYRYDRSVNAVGINCFIQGNGTSLKTTHVPRFEQKEIVERNTETFSMKDLSENPISVLQKAKIALEEGIEAFKNLFQSKITDIERVKFNEDLRLCNKELDRFEKGIKILNTYPDCLEAFKLTNKTFLSTSKGYISWKLFQLVFIVSNIPDIASEEHDEIKNSRNEVELLYFPTGSGKTEAFLGVSILQAFFDRLSGKKLGTSVIAKFPLRMLSLQQLQRVADIFGAAEMVRRQTNAISSSDYDPFSVGYYVGSKNTPNSLTASGYSSGGESKNILESLSEEEAQKYLIVKKCPFCSKEKVKIVIDAQAIRLRHICQNCSKELNVFISDSEIYRYLPTFIVSTLDKIVICGSQRNFRNILGQVRYKCPEHGYTSYTPNLLKPGMCVEHTCKVPVERFIPLKELNRPEPSILIQDELHLVREKMGAFDANYETLINYMLNLFSNKKRDVKILAATATISQYEKQIYELYLRTANRFPAAIETYTKEATGSIPKRQIIGIMPHGQSKVRSMLDVLTNLFIEIQNTEKGSYSKMLDPNSDEITKNVKTVLSYHIKKRDSDVISGSVGTMINRELSNINYKEISRESLTGDVGFEVIRDITESIESGAQKAPDLLLATNLISHGVDLERLNIMLFMGMPENVAEYIQALSRVGRKYPALIIVVFDPLRERDQSYYKYFRKFHEMYELLIGSTPLNRWSKRGIEIVTPGIFSASVLNYFELNQLAPARLDLCKDFKKAYMNQAITKRDLLNFVKTALGVDKAPYIWVNEEIENSFERLLNQILNTTSQDEERRPIYMMMSPKPLNNLRNIDAGVEISLNIDTEIIVNNYDIKSSKTREE